MEQMYFGGEDRFFGTHEQSIEQLTQAWPVFGDTKTGESPDKAPELILPSQYVPTWQNPGDNNDFYIEKQGGVGDQDGQGACGSISAVELTELIQLKGGIGDAFTKLSWGQLYWSINGGSDNGTVPERNLIHLRTKGVASTKVIPIDVRNRSQRWSPEVEASAQENMVVEWMLTPTPGHAISALMQGFVLHASLWWYNGDNTNGAGWLPDNPGGRRGGHSIRITEYINENGKQGFRFPNTWTSRWGVQGFGKLSLGRAADNMRSWVWWAARAVKPKVDPTPFPQPIVK
jgi:hypothetical protein